MRFLFTRLFKPRERPGSMGFTLLEALLVVALLGILVSLAAPTMRDAQTRYRLQGQAEGFLGSLVLARSEALRRQQRLTVCPRANDTACDSKGEWYQGWLVFVDSNNNALREADELLIEVHAAMPLGVTMVVTGTSKAYFSYDSEGRSSSKNGAFMAGTWRFCHATSAVGWQVVSNALGKPRIEKYAPQECK